ncbi:hypothetical protein L6452_28554 [Arctium lappa]|uniref:Uncharacterized protein n=1 Tax=Arctium lappa TaxID=4217 RepID=A0ACB8ZXR6_ARCLA|nr:hypothetical protein L6452_28554 [Arctium lappa]
MASGTLDADKIRKEKCKWGCGNKVYTRRPKNGIKTAATTTVSAAAVSPSTAVRSSPVTTANNDQTLTHEDANLRRERTLSRVAEVSDDSSSQNLGFETIVRTGNGFVRPVVTLVDDRVKIHLEASTSKDEIKELREKLTVELDQVRSLVRKLEDKEAELANDSTLLGAAVGNDEVYSRSQYSGNVTNDRRALVRVNSEMGADYMDRRALSRVHSEMGYDTIDRRILTRVNSEVGSLANHDATRFRQLNISVVDNNGLGVGEFVEKEKRTPKANQYYRNSDFLLGKDRLPPESNKRLKSNGGRKYSRESSDYTVGLERQKNQVFRNCNNLLQRLMKHKHGWVFNEPVNAKLLGLHDYHNIIKHPMDLGTIKSRLAQNFYKNPSEFAEDVRLTFRNAMTYNPKGQDVHVMAEQLSNIFEERWAVIESEYNREWRYGTIHDSGTTPTPNSRKIHHFTHAPISRLEPMTLPYVSRPKASNFTPSSRTPAPTKPKAKDPNKRNMTYEEKQKLSANLQSLPSEKLDNIVQIIKKSNTSLSQHDDEIEVDIDSVDVETLWELDRFVTNYKKSLSKHRRKAELAQQARALAGNANRTMLENPATFVPDASTEKRAAEKSLVVRAVRAAILDLLRVIQIVTVPLQMDQMQGFHLEIERSRSR